MKSIADYTKEFTARLKGKSDSEKREALKLTSADLERLGVEKKERTEEPLTVSQELAIMIRRAKMSEDDAAEMAESISEDLIAKLEAKGVIVDGNREDAIAEIKMSTSGMLGQMVDDTEKAQAAGKMVDDTEDEDDDDSEDDDPKKKKKKKAESEDDDEATTKALKDIVKEALAEHNALGFSEQVKEFGDVAVAMDAIAQLMEKQAGANKALRKDVDALKAILGKPSRRASVDAATLVKKDGADADLLETTKEQAVQTYSEQWGIPTGGGE